MQDQTFIDDEKKTKVDTWTMQDQTRVDGFARVHIAGLDGLGLCNACIYVCSIVTSGIARMCNCVPPIGGTFLQRAAMLTLQALYQLRQFRPSVCRTPVLCQNDGTQHSAVCTVGFGQQTMSSFVETKKIFPRGDPFPLKSWLQVTYPLLKAASFDTFCLAAPQP